jgi:flagellar basal-body rod protein FlgC
MNFLDALRIGASGLSAQRLRMNVTSSNLANINTTRTPGGGPYRRKDVVFAGKPLNPSFKSILNQRLGKPISEVRVKEIVEDPRQPHTKYNPSHPDADEKGYVKTPNINLMEEMANMISASRSYEANATAIKATKDMALKALEIGR